MESLDDLINHFKDKPFRPFTRRVNDSQSNNPEYVVTLAEDCSIKEEISDFSIDFLFQNHSEPSTLVGLHIYYTKTEFVKIENLFELVFMTGITDFVRIVKSREYDKILNCLYVYAQCLIFCGKQPQKIEDK